MTKDLLAGNPMYKIAFDQLNDSWATCISPRWHHGRSVLVCLDEIEKEALSPAQSLDKAADSLRKEWSKRKSAESAPASPGGADTVFYIYIGTSRIHK
jgi:hypothetical protein